MEIGSSSLVGPGSRCCSWILIVPFVLLCGPLLCCCCLALGAAGIFIDSPHNNVAPLPGLDDIPSVQTVPVIPAIPTMTPTPGDSLPLLDPEGIPLFGSATLESGFSPDPYDVEAKAGGSVDTADFSSPCGYTSYHPAFVLNWEGGGREPFLRISFTPDDDTDTTLLVLTPEGKWLCEEGSGTDPVLDLPSASPGEYAIWVGIQEDAAAAEGSLSITGLEEVTP